MAGIQEYLYKIKNAVYGREVRQAIHDGIHQCYEDGKAGAVDLVAREEIAELIAPSGEAPSAAEITDARIGVDAKTYTSLKQRIDTEVSSLQSNFFNHNALNLCSLMNHTNETARGITFRWNLDGSCTISGTSTSTTWTDLFISQNSLPKNISAGDVIQVSMHGTKVRFIIYDYSGGSVTNLIEIVNSSVLRKLPSSISGMIIRLWVPGGETINETVYPAIIKNGSTIKNASVNLGSEPHFIVSDANDINLDCTHFVSHSGGQPVIANVPYSPCWLETTITNENIVLQKAYPYLTSENQLMIRTKVGGTWGKWVAVGGNGYISAVDEDSASETGKTDMKAAIQYALDTYGHCKLSEGTFFISDHIIMPEGSTLEGCGESTTLRLMSGDAKSTVMMTKYCTISDLVISGSYTDLTESDFGSEIGSRYGIMYYKDSSVSWSTAYCSITNVHIRNFSGAGIYQYNTGANVEQGLFVLNTHIKNCWCGIYVYQNSEFCRYTNVQITYCYIACINNGGNNSFDNCVFHAYHIGFQIIGSRSNSAHGICSNSSFCHTGNNVGSAIKVDDVVNGYVFNALQVWYNSIDISNSSGIVFNGVEFGRGTTGAGATININGGNTVAFVGCMFVNDVSYPPDINISNNNKVKFANCYGSISGNEITE